MRRRRRHHHVYRDNPSSDTMKIVFAVFGTAAVVGIGYYLWKRQQSPATQLPSPQTKQLPSSSSSHEPSSSSQSQEKQPGIIKLGEQAGVIEPEQQRQVAKLNPRKLKGQVLGIDNDAGS